MALVTLFNSAKATLATDQLIYSATETTALLSVVEKVAALEDLYAGEEARIKQAVDAGFSEGFESGRESGLAAGANAHADQLTQVLQTASVERQQLRASAVTLSLDIVRTITTSIGSEDTLIALARKAASELVPHERATLKLHPERVSYVTERLHDSQTHEPLFMDVVGDDTLELDACVLQTSQGSVLADLDTQLRVIEKRLNGS